jgi:hypothetical protein
VLRDNYKLNKWVSKPNGRRHQYFGWCDAVIEKLKPLVEVGEGLDELVILGIVPVLKADDSFTTHILKKEGDFLADPDNWERLYRVGSGQILHEYLVAVENGKWPEDLA